MLDKSTRDKLVEENYKHAIRQTNYFEYMVPDKWDRQSLAAEALIRAVETYEPSRGTTLQTYITRCVQHKMLAEGRNIKRAKLRQPKMVPLDKSIGSKDGDALTIYDIIPSKEKTPLDQIVYGEDATRLQEALNKLPDQLREVLFARYINHPNMTQLEYGRQHNKTQRWASRQENVALSLCKDKYMLNLANK